MCARYNPRKQPSLKRSTGSRELKKRFLIICEGANTEPAYFGSFRLTSAAIRVLGRGRSTLALVREAMAIREAENKKGNNFDESWVVFDKDDFPASDFDSAIALAEVNGFRVAFSNQAFELWFLMHFTPIAGHLHRSEYARQLTNLLGFKYDKTEAVARKMYAHLLRLQPYAVENCKKLEKLKFSLAPSESESFTTVYRLVEELNKYL